MNELKGIYETDFNEIKKYIEKEAAPGTQRDEAIESLRAIYFEAQENGAELSEIRGESAKEYAKEVAECLPKKKTDLKKSAFSFFKVAVIAVIIIAAWEAYLFFTGDEFVLEQRGYNFVWSNPRKFIVETEEIFNAVTVSGGSSSTLTFTDELYTSHAFVQKSGTVGCTGFVKESGMSLEKFELSEDGKTLVIQMRATKSKTPLGVERIITPAYPTTVFDKNPVRNLEKEILNDAVESNIFYGSELCVTIEDCIYKSHKISGNITKEGDICFTYTLKLENDKDTAAAKKRIESGKAIPLDFETFYSLEWNYLGEERCRNIGLVTFGNSLLAKDIDVFYEYCEAQKEIDGFSFLIGAGIDWENEKILGYESIGFGNTENPMSFSVPSVEVGYGGRSISAKIEYPDENGEIKSEEVVFTLDDFV